MKQCDCCAKLPVKIHRRYKGEAYCSSCYQTWFAKKACDSCGEINRFHRDETYSVCKKCLMNMPCIRCAKPAVKNGANTEYGRVCTVCWERYFKEKKQCQECGEKKRDVFKRAELANDKSICTSCYHKKVMSSCTSCGRYRRLIDTAQGGMCKKCYDIGLSSCQTCNAIMPAGCGTRCWSCYWAERLERETQLNTYLFNSSKIKNSYKAFTMYFSESRGSKVAKLKHNNFIEFFVRCDLIWGEIPNYSALVHEFKPNGLRKNLTVLRWLIDTHQIEEDIQIKNKVAEQEYIVKLLDKFDGGLPTCIADYHAFLNGKYLLGKSTLKSIRLALSPAVRLCIANGISSSSKPNQSQIDQFLVEHHGQFSAIYGFISFLNDTYDMNLVHNKPDKQKVRLHQRKVMHKRIIHFLNEDNQLTKKEEFEWYQLAFHYFHDVKVSINNIKKMNPKIMFKQDEKVALVTFEGNEYWLPIPDKIVH